MYGLIDCNNFYVSCERVFQPQYNGVPVVVLSNNDGCAISRSAEAKALNIPMGAPAFQWKQHWQDNNVKVFSSNYALYGDLSERVMQILKAYSPKIEEYSIDEAFLDFNGISIPDYKDYGLDMKKRILKWLGIPIGVGIAKTKSLCKVANKIAKKFPELNGVHVIDSEEKRIKALKWTKIEDVWGFGRQHSAKLKSFGIFNAMQFAEKDLSWVQEHFSIVEERMWYDLNGTPAISFEEVQDKKGIMCSRSFDKALNAKADIAERLVANACKVAEKLRLQKSHCNQIEVFITTGRFSTDSYSRKMVIETEFATNSSIEISKYVMKALDEIYLPSFRYKKSGVYVSRFTPENQDQLSLFSNKNEKHPALMKVMDQMNLKYRKKVLKLAREPKVQFKMNQENLSPNYTRNWNEILTIKI